MVCGDYFDNVRVLEGGDIQQFGVSRSVVESRGGKFFLRFVRRCSFCRSVYFDGACRCFVMNRIRRQLIGVFFAVFAI